MERINGSPEPYIIQYLHNKAGRMKRPVNATFELTSRCNFNCKMCYVHDADCNRNRPLELTAAQWIDIAGQAEKAGTLFVLLTGGEPLLREDFGEIYAAIAKMGFVISVNTNLSLLTEETLELFTRYRPNRVNVSLYGADNGVYAALCGVPAFETVAANIKKLRQREIPVKINSSITPYNLANAPDIMRFCEENNLHLKATAYMFPSARLGCCRERLSPQAAAEFRAAVDRYKLTAEEFAERTRRITEGIAFERERECPEIDTPERGIRCRAGSSTLWIDWRGNMSYCGMIPAPEDNNVPRLGFEACWRRTMAEAQAVRMPKKCLTCEYRHFCSLCAAAQFCETGGFEEPPSYVCEISARVPRAYQALCGNTPGGGPGKEQTDGFQIKK
ncbi:MAG: radical SAM protein [Clostridia bacterium]|nr:radical SAM protein [Clostridia bacterium]